MALFESYERRIDKINEVLNSYQQLNTLVLNTFKQCEDYFVKLTWEDASQFPHEHSVNNIINLENSIDALNNNDVTAALDEYLWAIDNNWYAYDFSKETYNYLTDYVLYQNEDKLMWGTNRVQGHNDLYDVIHSLMEKDENSDLSDEIAILNNCLDNEKDLLKKISENHIKSLKEIRLCLFIEDKFVFIFNKFSKPCLSFSIFKYNSFCISSTFSN